MSSSSDVGNDRALGRLASHGAAGGLGLRRMELGRRVRASRGRDTAVKSHGEDEDLGDGGDDNVGVTGAGVDGDRCLRHLGRGRGGSRISGVGGASSRGSVSRSRWLRGRRSGAVASSVGDEVRDRGTRENGSVVERGVIRVQEETGVARAVCTREGGGIIGAQRRQESGLRH